uniref:Uncharacterized protein n=1 Tax=Plectus sambesii TaxID=2011161 RepID=A0A914X2E2_9BILA
MLSAAPLRAKRCPLSSRTRPSLAGGAHDEQSHPQPIEPINYFYAASAKQPAYIGRDKAKHMNVANNRPKITDRSPRRRTPDTSSTQENGRYLDEFKCKSHLDANQLTDGAATTAPAVGRDVR